MMIMVPPDILANGLPMRPVPLLLLLGLLAVVVSPAGTSAEEAPRLAKLLPPGANTLAVLRVQEMLGTERAIEENWRQEQLARLENGVGGIPPWANTIVVGSLVHPAVPEEVWSAAVLERPELITMKSIADELGVELSTLAGVPVFPGRREDLVFQPSDDLIAAYRPAHRQDAARWIDRMRGTPSETVSDYLLGAAEKSGHIVLAMDLRSLLDEQRVRQIVSQDDRFKEHRELIEPVVRILNNVQGITLQVVMGKTNRATVTIDFDSDPTKSTLAVKTMFVSAVDDLGASLPEFRKAKATPRGNAVVLSMPLSDPSLRRILSLIVTPSTPYQTPEPEVAETTVPDNTKPTGSKPTEKKRQKRQDSPNVQYYKSVVQLIRDLSQLNRRANNYARTALWHDNFARKVIELPTTGVDDELLKFGRDTASRLRAVAASLRGQVVKVNAAQQTLTYDVNYNPGWASVNIWGGVGYRAPTTRWTSNLQEVRTKQAQAIAAGATQREEIWSMIQSDVDYWTQKLESELNDPEE